MDSPKVEESDQAPVTPHIGGNKFSLKDSSPGTAIFSHRKSEEKVATSTNSNRDVVSMVPDKKFTFNSEEFKFQKQNTQNNFAEMVKFQNDKDLKIQRKQTAQEEAIKFNDLLEVKEKKQI